MQCQDNQRESVGEEGCVAHQLPTARKIERNYIQGTGKCESQGNKLDVA